MKNTFLLMSAVFLTSLPVMADSSSQACKVLIPAIPSTAISPDLEAGLKSKGYSIERLAIEIDDHSGAISDLMVTLQFPKSGLKLHSAMAAKLKDSMVVFNPMFDYSSQTCIARSSSVIVSLGGRSPRTNNVEITCSMSLKANKVDEQGQVKSITEEDRQIFSATAKTTDSAQVQKEVVDLFLAQIPRCQ